MLRIYAVSEVRRKELLVPTLIFKVIKKKRLILYLHRCSYIIVCAWFIAQYLR